MKYNFLICFLSRKVTLFDIGQTYTANFTTFTQFLDNFFLPLEKLSRIEKTDLSKVQTKQHF